MDKIKCQRERHQTRFGTDSKHKVLEPEWIKGGGPGMASDEQAFGRGFGSVPDSHAQALPLQSLNH